MGTSRKRLRVSDIRVLPVLRRIMVMGFFRGGGHRGMDGRGNGRQSKEKKPEVLI